MRRVHWIMLLGLWLLLVSPVAAQSAGVRIDDPDGLLGGEVDQVRQAAQRLADEGAEVIVIAAGPSAGTSLQSAQAFLSTQLPNLSFDSAGRPSGLAPNQIVFAVARDAQQTFLLYGQRWGDALGTSDRQIREQQMNPQFASGNLAGGLIAGIDTVQSTINPSNAPLYLIGGALAATAAGAAAVPALRRRRQNAATLGTARERMEQARRAAGAAIADLGQLVQTAQDKAAYDRISYAQTDVARLSELQSEGEQLFAQAQAAFDAAGEAERAKATLSAPDYAAIATQYDQAQHTAQQASTLIQQAEALRASLDARGTPSTGPTTRLDRS